MSLSRDEIKQQIRDELANLKQRAAAGELVQAEYRKLILDNFDVIHGKRVITTSKLENEVFSDYAELVKVVGDGLTAYGIDLFVKSKDQISKLGGAKKAFEGKAFETDFPDVRKLILGFNYLSAYVMKDILDLDKVDHAVMATEFWINVAYYLAVTSDLKDYDQAMSIYSALNKSAVLNLRTRAAEVGVELLNVGAEAKLEQLGELLVSKDNFAKLRAAYEMQKNAGAACVPYIGVTLSDLTFIDEGNQDVKGDGGVKATLRATMKKQVLTPLMDRIKKLEEVNNVNAMPNIQTLISSQAIVNKTVENQLDADLIARSNLIIKKAVVKKDILEKIQADVAKEDIKTKEKLEKQALKEAKKEIKKDIEANKNKNLGNIQALNEEKLRKIGIKLDSQAIYDVKEQFNEGREKLKEENSEKHKELMSLISKMEEFLNDFGKYANKSSLATVYSDAYVIVLNKKNKLDLITEEEKERLRKLLPILKENKVNQFVILHADLLKELEGLGVDQAISKYLYSRMALEFDGSKFMPSDKDKMIGQIETMLKHEKKDESLTSDSSSSPTLEASAMSKDDFKQMVGDLKKKLTNIGARLSSDVTNPKDPASLDDEVAKEDVDKALKSMRGLLSYLRGKDPQDGAEQNLMREVNSKFTSYPVNAKTFFELQAKFFNNVASKLQADPDILYNKLNGAGEFKNKFNEFLQGYGEKTPSPVPSISASDSLSTSSSPKISSDVSSADTSASASGDEDSLSVVGSASSSPRSSVSGTSAPAASRAAKSPSSPSSADESDAEYESESDETKVKNNKGKQKEVDKSKDKVKETPFEYQVNSIFVNEKTFRDWMGFLCDALKSHQLDLPQNGRDTLMSLIREYEAMASLSPFPADVLTKDLDEKVEIIRNFYDPKSFEKNSGFANITAAAFSMGALNKFLNEIEILESKFYKAAKKELNDKMIAVGYEGEELAFPEFTIKPVQRLGQYVLHLNDLQKQCGDDAVLDGEFEELKKPVDKLVAKYNRTRDEIGNVYAPFQHDVLKLLQELSALRATAWDKRSGRQAKEDDGVSKQIELIETAIVNVRKVSFDVSEYDKAKKREVVNEFAKAQSIKKLYEIVDKLASDIKEERVARKIPIIGRFLPAQLFNAASTLGTSQLDNKISDIRMLLPDELSKEKFKQLQKAALKKTESKKVELKELAMSEVDLNKMATDVPVSVVIPSRHVALENAILQLSASVRESASLSSSSASVANPSSYVPPTAEDKIKLKGLMANLALHLESQKSHLFQMAEKIKTNPVLNKGAPEFIAKDKATKYLASMNALNNYLYASDRDDDIAKKLDKLSKDGDVDLVELLTLQASLYNHVGNKLNVYAFMFDGIKTEERFQEEIEALKTLEENVTRLNEEGLVKIDFIKNEDDDLVLDESGLEELMNDIEEFDLDNFVFVEDENKSKKLSSSSSLSASGSASGSGSESGSELESGSESGSGSGSDSDDESDKQVKPLISSSPARVLPRFANALTSLFTPHPEPPKPAAADPNLAAALANEDKRLNEFITKAKDVVAKMNERNTALQSLSMLRNRNTLERVKALAAGVAPLVVGVNRRVF